MKVSLAASGLGWKAIGAYMHVEGPMVTARALLAGSVEGERELSRQHIVLAVWMHHLGWMGARLSELCEINLRGHVLVPGTSSRIG